MWHAHACLIRASHNEEHQQENYVNTTCKGYDSTIPWDTLTNCIITSYSQQRKNSWKNGILHIGSQPRHNEWLEYIVLTRKNSIFQLLSLGHGIASVLFAPRAPLLSEFPSTPGVAASSGWRLTIYSFWKQWAHCKIVADSWWDPERDFVLFFPARRWPQTGFCSASTNRWAVVRSFTRVEPYNWDSVQPDEHHRLSSRFSRTPTQDYPNSHKPMGRLTCSVAEPERLSQDNSHSPRTLCDTFETYTLFSYGGVVVCSTGEASVICLECSNW